MFSWIWGRFYWKSFCTNGIPPRSVLGFVWLLNLPAIKVCEPPAGRNTTSHNLKLNIPRYGLWRKITFEIWGNVRSWEHLDTNMKEFELSTSWSLFSPEGFCRWRWKWAKIYQEQAERMENERRLNFRFYCKPPLLLLTGPESPVGGNKRDGKTLGWQEVGGGGGGGKEKRYGGKGAKRDISTETRCWT